MIIKVPMRIFQDFRLEEARHCGHLNLKNITVLHFYPWELHKVGGIQCYMNDMEHSK